MRDVREMGERLVRYERDPRDFDKHGTTVQLWTIQSLLVGLISPHRSTAIARNVDTATTSSGLLIH